jgi:hypothetical protein
MADPFSSDVLLIGTVQRLAGTVDPRVGGGVAAPTGSIYFRTTGAIYTKNGAGATAWIEVGVPFQTVLVTGAATDTITFTGLDGDNDGMYILQASIIDAVGISPADVRVRPNGSAAANAATVGFFYDFLTSATDQSTEWNLWRLQSAAAGDIYSCTGWIWPATGKPRTSFAQIAGRLTGVREVEGRVSYSKWDETATNITSLVLNNAAAIFGVGTRVSLSKIALAA